MALPCPDRHVTAAAGHHRAFPTTNGNGGWIRSVRLVTDLRDHSGAGLIPEGSSQALWIVRENGRSERIRTSDPLLPKQVRYQAALRSDRVGRELPNPEGICKRYSCGYLRVPAFRARCRIEGRGVVTVSVRPRVRRTGVFCDTSAVLSRQTM